MPQRPYEVRTVTFFPDTIPDPTVDGPLEMPPKTLTDIPADASKGTRPLTLGGHRVFLYTWEQATPRTRDILANFVATHQGMPIRGWTHPGKDAEYTVAFSDVVIPRQQVEAGQTTYTLELAVFILTESPASNTHN
ncbi:hypothetical protein GKC30_08565 [Pseudodesulfovibrio sp. F-1]|uniref:Uncharacterized protein n=1 Tax=Pseudodesulfovibrio alkaliphilus TaxID=2661613 RepID=A0A7K1KNL5_9BACT|nr:hypothetical protein [Pseudodesulfovibrio alkaliphilus]MUM77684.1 hypothetical protein [Pseudodesulfovibrio alkaliphilus]